MYWDLRPPPQLSCIESKIRSQTTYPILKLSPHGPGPAEQHRSATPANRGRDDWSRGSKLDRLFSASAHHVPLGTGLASRQTLGNRPSASVYCCTEICHSCSCIVRDPEAQTTTAQA